MENLMGSFLIFSLMLSIALAYPTGDPSDDDLAESRMNLSSDEKLVRSNMKNEEDFGESLTDQSDDATAENDPTPDDGPQTKEEQLKEIQSEEDDDLFEGDLKLDKDTMAAITSQTDSKKRDVISNKKRHWKDGRVPYKFSSNFDEKRRETVAKAIALFKKATCLKFVGKKESDKDYIEFMINPRYCYSTSIGKVPSGGKQQISIGNGCNYVGVVLHEMMHAIGFYHEQSRLDRDDYINILWDNIQHNMESQFRKYSHGEADFFGEPYDYKSIMHYPKRAFGRKGATTIVPKTRQWTIIGQREGFSEIDVRQINKAYCRR